MVSGLARLRRSSPHKVVPLDLARALMIHSNKCRVATVQGRDLSICEWFLYASRAARSIQLATYSTLFTGG